MDFQLIEVELFNLRDTFICNTKRRDSFLAVVPCVKLFCLRVSLNPHTQGQKTLYKPTFAYCELLLKKS